jgi:hypothetical protein
VQVFEVDSYLLLPLGSFSSLNFQLCPVLLHLATLPDQTVCLSLFINVFSMASHITAVDLTVTEKTLLVSTAFKCSDD